MAWPKGVKRGSKKAGADLQKEQVEAHIEYLNKNATLDAAISSPEVPGEQLGKQYSVPEPYIARLDGKRVVLQVGSQYIFAVDEDGNSHILGYCVGEYVR